MDQRTLVEEQIDDGRKLMDLLRQNNILVAAGGWVKESEAGFWYLYIVTPLVDEHRGSTGPAYHRINRVFRALPEPLAVTFHQVKVVGESAAIGRAILEIQRRPRRHPAQLGEGTLGGVEIDAAYIYPPFEVNEVSTRPS